jgi:hypothetical protein
MVTRTKKDKYGTSINIASRTNETFRRISNPEELILPLNSFGT